MAGEGNEEMATVGNRTGMVGTGAESQAADTQGWAWGHRVCVCVWFLVSKFVDEHSRP